MDCKQRATARAVATIMGVAAFFREKAAVLDMLAARVEKSGEFNVRDAGLVVAEVIIMPVAKIEALQSIAEDIVQHTYDEAVNSNTSKNDYNAV